MKAHTLRLLTVSAIYFSLNPALAADIVGRTVAPAGASVPASRIASRFESLAGSPENAASLVAGLRSGSVVTLASTDPAGSIRFAPPTTQMGYGNIARALSLAQRQLAAQGIVQPTPEQLRIALNGGTLTGVNSRGATRAVEMPGVLQLRSQGMGWGQIAHQIDLSPGNHPPPAAPSAARNAPPTAARVDLRGSSHGHGAIVSGDGSILHGRAPGYGGAAKGSAQTRTGAAAKASVAAHVQAGRPAFAATNSPVGIGNPGKGPPQARGHGRL